MSIKVGLISYHFLNNYGTMLQAYALQRKICELGFEAEYIDYRFQELRPSLFNVLLMRIKRFGIYIYQYKYYSVKAAYLSKLSIRKEYFKDFYTKHIRTSPSQYATIRELELQQPEYDIYIVGSDQVWNPNLSCARPAYYLSFVKDNKKKASYAPSVGVVSLTSDQEQKMAGYIRNFNYLSCREISGAKLLENISGRNISHVLDPTFLLDKTIWEEIAIRPRITEPYILCYFLGDTKQPREFALQLENKTGIKAYYIPCSPLDMSKKTAIYDVGPAEFLGLIQNASYVCTDSFHGNVFSIIFERQFYSFCKRADTELTSDNSRIKELLKYTGLENRLITIGQRFPDEKNKIDYQLVESYLGPMKERSESYLLGILHSTGGRSYVV
ncbi:MAG TPA: polysaccharide pyruvyl transferase family protein [Desulfotomaculum sp.]|nr:MAG: Polysaccharide pyruvyl transferase [Desulfotomaculum sp. 46_80]HAG10960.1 polysaccharide pyruvyl transferase family protein [Desulfotomaculum sp.]